MTTMTVVKDDTGKLRGFTAKDQRAYSRFKKLLDALGQGEIFTLDYWFPREGWRHRKHFAMLALIFDAQEQFADPEQMRLWLQVGAGHCEFVPLASPKRAQVGALLAAPATIVAIPKSIAYSAMDDAEFTDHHEKVKAFLRSEHAQRFLWPHLAPAETMNTVETILYEFENEERR
jgi:hypothetical protein